MKSNSDREQAQPAGSLAEQPEISSSGNSQSTESEKQWFRGQLHCHSFYSDGHAFPEQVAEAYKQRGYNFLAITDHCRFADDKEAWRNVEPDEGTWPPKISREAFEAYVREFGKDWVDSKTEGQLTTVRLKTYEEFKALCEEPGKFLLLPGVESTLIQNGLHVHMNYINLPVLLPSITGVDIVKTVEDPQDPSALVALNAAEAKQAAAQLNRPYLFMLDHPFWIYWDVRPEVLLDCPDVRFFEIVNNGSNHAPHPEALSYTPDKFWDIVNAFRSMRNQPLLFGVASDDTHYYDEKRRQGEGGLADGWVMVRARSLSPDALLSAMHQGDFYATTGVQLDEVSFSPKSKTLRLKVKQEPGVDYRIDFITTKEGFDQQMREVKSEPVRMIPLYSDEIGRTVKTVTGTEASYQMQPDDLYVRARVESTRPCQIAPYFHPQFQTAWTQPFTTRKAAGIR